MRFFHFFFIFFLSSPAGQKKLAHAAHGYAVGQHTTILVATMGTSAPTYPRQRKLSLNLAAHLGLQSDLSFLYFSVKHMVERA